MPLSAKGRKMKKAMQKTYGKDKGTQVFYATVNKGKVTGLEASGRRKRKRK